MSVANRLVSAKVPNLEKFPLSRCWNVVDRFDRVMRCLTGKNLKQAINDNVAVTFEIHTDDNGKYRGLDPLL